MAKPDYSEYLTPEQLAHEERLWGEVKLYEKYAAVVTRAFDLAGLAEEIKMIEVGCGTGWVPSVLTNRVAHYLGIDKNKECVARAIEKNRPNGALFVRMDLRDLEFKDDKYDVACAFAVLKHFALAEWDEVFARFLSLGNWTAFTLPTQDGAGSLDDGLDFPHVRIGRSHLLDRVAAARHEVADFGPLEGEAEEWFVTRYTDAG